MLELLLMFGWIPIVLTWGLGSPRIESVLLGLWILSTIIPIVCFDGPSMIDSQTSAPTTIEEVTE